ncbi:Thiosulfate sulfurtransferase rdl2, mitochondrial [Sporothrix curviconia]|uniref:Thiosulfate sulfurtransferase rdl2, mitochondrial n=1 Tax=Sporothrix curviconia TaxID=1260050 RepID=A0ABP0C9G4_9PEZI
MVANINRRAAHAVSVLLRQTVAKPASTAVVRCSMAVAARPQQQLARRRSLAAASCTAAPSLSLLARRAYSSSAPADHKIWSFEDMQKLVKKPESSIVIIDAREPAELKDTGRIPGAINIPVTTAPDGFFLPDEEFEDRFGFARPDRDTEVIFYCKAGVRSRAAAGLAKEAGWTKVGEYPGSWLDWSGKGGPIER